MGRAHHTQLFMLFTPKDLSTEALGWTEGELAAADGHRLQKVRPEGELVRDLRGTCSS